PSFTFPEATPAAHWSEPPRTAAETAPVAPTAIRSADTFDLAPLVARIAAAPRTPEAQAGRRILIVETEDRRGVPTLPEALTRTLGREGSLVA
ncbi:lipopolysaccharide biosynthesis protein, partial [Escherichia coli]|nr:lipopolysaccharide biosynthesis protein [Escherichia coli]